MRSNWILMGVLVALVAGLIGCGGDSKPAPTPTPTPTVAPNPPLNVRVLELSATSVRVFWGDNSSNETGFRVKRAVGSGSFSVVGTVSSNVTTYDDTTAAAGTSYTYRVESFNSTGSTPAASDAPITTAAAPTTAPASPTNLGTLAQSSTQINLVWTDNSSNEDGFKIERSATSGSGFVQIATVGTNTVAYSAIGLTAGTKYYFRVRAYNTASTPNSVYSNEANATTNAASGGTGTWVKVGNLPTAPRDFVVSGQNLYLGTYVGFYRSTDGGVSWTKTVAGGPAYTLAVGTWDPLVLYGSGGVGSGVDGSTNGGTTWQYLSTIPMGPVYGLATRSGSVYAASKTGIFVSKNDGQTWRETYTANFNLSIARIPIAVAWDDWDRVYVVSSTGYMRTSSDGGNTWSGSTYNVSQLSNFATEVWSIAVNPLDGQKLYAATNAGLYKSTDAGKTWALAAFSGQGVTTVLIDRVTPYPMYTVSSSLGIAKSTDGGTTWTAENVPGSGVLKLAFDEQSASTYFLKTTSNLYLAIGTELYKKQ